MALNESETDISCSLCISHKHDSLAVNVSFALTHNRPVVHQPDQSILLLKADIAWH